MSVSKLFLWDFLTAKKTRMYVIVLFLFVVGALSFKDSNPNFVISSNLAANIGIMAAFFSTTYVIYTYTTFDKIKAYLILPFEKWQVFYAYVFALYFTLILQRISLLIVVIIFFTKQPIMLVIYLLVGSLLTTIINVNLLLSLNSKQYLITGLSIVSLIVEYYVFTYGFGWLINILVAFALFFINILSCLHFNPKDLAILRNIKTPNLSKMKLNYFFYVMIREKIIMVNTLAVVVITFVYTLTAPNNPLILSVVWGFGAVNTPLLTMFSGDRALAKQERLLPSRSKLMYGMYGRFLLVYFILVNSYVLVLQHFLKNNANVKMIFLSILLIPLEVLASIYLEKKHRIGTWQTKQDLWRNPRKYVLPLAVILISSLFCL